MKVERTCEHCQRTFLVERGQVNAGRGRFCTMACSGARRRKHIPADEKKRLKAEYDREYRRKNASLVKAKKAAYFKRTYDPEKARAFREANRGYLAEVKRRCYMRPEYRAHKAQKDREYRCRQDYGEWWEAASLLIDLDREIDRQMPDYEVRKSKGTLNKTQRRKRAYATAQRSELERCSLGNSQLGQIR